MPKFIHHILSLFTILCVVLNSADAVMYPSAGISVKSIYKVAAASALFETEALSLLNESIPTGIDAHRTGQDLNRILHMAPRLSWGNWGGPRYFDYAARAEQSLNKFPSFAALIAHVYQLNTVGIHPDGINLESYPAVYGKHAVYHLLSDLEKGGYSVDGKSVMEGVGIQGAHKVLNKELGRNIYQQVMLRISVFFGALERIVVPGEFVSYSGLAGMLDLAGKLVEKFGTKAVHLGILHQTLGSQKGEEALLSYLRERLTGEEIGPLGWERIDFPYQRLLDAAKEIGGHPKEYAGVVGMLKLAKWLADRGEEPHMGHLFTAFGGDRGPAVVRHLTGEEIGPLGWEFINVPYQRLLDAAKEIGGHPKEYAGVVGMLKLAKWLADRGEEPHMGTLYTAFGGDRGPAVVRHLTGEEIGPLGWERIDFPYQRLLDAAKEIGGHPKEYAGVVGMLKLAKWLADRGEEPHMGHLFTAFGGDRGPAVVRHLTGEEIGPLGWEFINVPYQRLLDAAKEIGGHPKEYAGVVGMLKLAKWLADRGEEPHMGTLYTAFGGDRGPAVVRHLTGEEIGPLGWEFINVPYQRLLDAAKEIGGHPKEYAGVVGMLKLAKWLADRGEEPHMGTLYTAFGGDRGPAVVRHLTGEEIGPLGWERIDFPYQRLLDAAKEIGGHPKEYAGVVGMLKLAKWLADRGEEPHMGHLFTAFGGDRGPAVVRHLTGEEIGPLGWERIDFPYQRLLDAAKEIGGHPKEYAGVVGMLKLAKWLADRGEEPHMGTLYTAFGGDRGPAVVRHLTGEEIGPLGWERIDFPYQRLLDAAKEIGGHPKEYAGVVGMLKLAKWLADRGEEPHMGHLFTAFGGDRGPAVVRHLTGEEIGPLGWERIDFPYQRLLDAAKEIGGHPKEYAGVVGMLKLAKWLADRGEEPHMGHLFTAFGGDRGPAVVRHLTGEEIGPLGWEFINVPYQRLLDAAKEIGGHPKEYAGVVGMLKLAKWLADRGEEPHMGHLFTAFGGDRGPAVVRHLTGEEIGPLGWERIDFPYQRLLDAAKEIGGHPKEYAGVVGMLKLAKWLADRGEEPHMGTLYTAFGGDRGPAVVRHLTGEEIGPLGWERIDFPYQRLLDAAKEIGGHPKEYAGVVGMLKLAKWLADRGEEPHMGTLYTAFGGDRGPAVVRHLTGEEIGPLGWERIDFPYQRLLDAAKEIGGHPKEYAGVVGMLKLAKWLADRGEEPHMGTLYTAFGGDRGPAVVRHLTGEEIGPLGWERIDFPYQRLLDAAKEIGGHPKEYAGVVGMLKLAKWLADRGEEPHMGHLFTAFGGDRGPAVVRHLTGEEIGPLGWEFINVPYQRLLDAAKEIGGHPKEYAGVVGMLKLAKWLADRGEEPHMGHLFTAFGGDRGPAVVRHLTGEEIGPLGWERIDFPYQRLLDAAKEIGGHPKEYAGVVGMLKLAKWLADRGEEPHMGTLYTAFGGDRGPAVVRHLTGEEIGPLGWERIDFPYQRLLDAAKEIGGHPKEYAGVVGMLKLAKWLADRGEEPHMGTLYTAFGGDRGPAVVRHLTGEEIGPLGWKTLQLPYAQVRDLIIDILREHQSDAVAWNRLQRIVVENGSASKSTKTKEILGIVSILLANSLLMKLLGNISSGHVFLSAMTTSFPIHMSPLAASFGWLTLTLLAFKWNPHLNLLRTKRIVSESLFNRAA